jgi:hypothetical protein
MKNTKQNLLMILLLVALSAGLYGLQVTIFQTFRDTSFYFLQDLAFLPLQVAIVTIVLGRVVSEWNKRERLKKINMAISAFFSEAGTEIMMKLTQLIENNDELKPGLTIGIGWTASEFSAALKVLKKAELKITCAGEDLESL